MIIIDDIKLKYSVGALLYTPALNDRIASKVIDGSFGHRYSLALCLEDTISEEAVEIAEAQVKETLRRIGEASKDRNIYIPKLFIRVRTPGQLERVFGAVRSDQSVLTGFVLPKYSSSNAEAYNAAIREINRIADKKIYMMPILESGDIIDFRTRMHVLGMIKDYIDSMREYVLNVRVGGNDFSNEFAVRRHCDETIYDILPIAQVLGDILTVFSREYVVSGPVWEYFSGEGDDWEKGLRRELQLDRLNGFIGKTVIHPKQIPIVNEMLKVTAKDHADARSILNWDENGLRVGKSFGGERMNEVRTHENWAMKTMLLSELYGIQ